MSPPGMILTLSRYLESKARDCKLYPAVPEAPEVPDDPQNEL